MGFEGILPGRLFRASLPKFKATMYQNRAPPTPPIGGRGPVFAKTWAPGPCSDPLTVKIRAQTSGNRIATVSIFPSAGAETRPPALSFQLVVRLHATQTAGAGPTRIHPFRLDSGHE